MGPERYSKGNLAFKCYQKTGAQLQRNLTAIPGSCMQNGHGHTSATGDESSFGLCALSPL